VIDCDPGIDDMAAILLACASPEVELLGITTVAGNVSLEHTTRNALRILALAGRQDIPVAPGAARPLVIPAPRRSQTIHGDDGLGGLVLPDSDARPDPRGAVEFLAATVRATPEPVTLVAVGPLTNVALFYALYPDLAARLARLVVMGGSIGAGNVTPAAEFNVWHDPEAAYRVLTAPGLPRPVPTTLIGLDVTLTTALTPADLDTLRRSDGIGRVLADPFQRYLDSYRRVLGLEVVAVHDAVAVLEAVLPGSIQVQPARVTVDTTLGPSRGNTAVDLRAEDGATAEPSTVQVGVAADPRAIAEHLLTRLSSLPTRPGSGPGESAQ